ncbi:MAG: inositol monophosphatase family protein [Alcaligenes sp.]
MDAKLILQECSDLIYELMPEVMRRRFKIKYKSDNSPVTEADYLIEKEVSAYLKSKVSDLVFVGEESFSLEEIDPNATIALLDPIDGTENFCSGLKEWGTSLGIWKGGEHLASMLLLPELGGKLATGDKVEKRTSRITGLSSSFHEDILKEIKDNQESRITGCAVYNLYNVATGAFKRFVNPKGAYAWDLLPGLMIALEQNCEVYVNGELYDGKFLQPNRKYRVDIRN